VIATLASPPVCRVVVQCVHGCEELERYPLGTRRGGRAVEHITAITSASADRRTEVSSRQVRNAMYEERGMTSACSVGIRRIRLFHT
jgi:hypothetical protein